MGAGWLLFSQLNGGQSNWCNFNLDGLTHDADLAIVG